MTRWVTGRGGKDAHRRCFHRMLEVFRIFSVHFQTQAAGPTGWMIFKCPEPPRVNPHTHPACGPLVLSSLLYQVWLPLTLGLG